MGFNVDKFDISQLNFSERVSLMGRLWDSLPPLETSITEEQKQELDRRQAMEDAGLISYSTWDEVKKNLLSKK